VYNHITNFPNPDISCRTYPLSKPLTDFKPTNNVSLKNRIVCNEDETRAIAPLGLQNALDEAMRRVENGRCFVRPSGTEDVVRVYAEASTTEGVGRLIELSVQAINQYAN
jgi:phosphomannomutase